MKTKSILFLGICLLLLSSCSSSTGSREKAQRFYDARHDLKFEDLAIIDYNKSGEFEFWILNNGRGSDFRWVYRNTDKQFVLDDVNKVNCLAYFQVDDPKPIFKKLQSTVKEYGIKKISQSPWPGNYVKFYFSPSAGLIYKPLGFNYKSDLIKDFEAVFSGGDALDEEWVFFEE